MFFPPLQRLELRWTSKWDLHHWDHWKSCWTCPCLLHKEPGVYNSWSIDIAVTEFLHFGRGVCMFRMVDSQDASLGRRRACIGTSMSSKHNAASDNCDDNETGPSCSTSCTRAGSHLVRFNEVRVAHFFPPSSPPRGVHRLHKKSRPPLLDASVLE